jgi:hypothetical protein
VIVPHTLCNSYRLHLTPQNILVAWMCHIKFLVFFKTSRRQESSVPWHVSTHCPLCYKFWMFCMCSTHQPSLCTVGNSSCEPSLIKFFFLFGPLSSSLRIRQIRCCTMGTPQNTRWGMRSSRSARLEPQNAWDSFLLATGIPEASKGGSYLCVENDGITPCGGRSGRSYAGRKKVGSHASPTTDTPEKRKAKEE